MKLPATNHREPLKNNIETTLDAARATALERIVSLSMDYQRGVGLVQFRNGVDAVIASSGYTQLIEKLFEIL
ncbi:MAG: hypothetical protein WA510_04405 [Acidobacteriaceae bacterium]